MLDFLFQLDHRIIHFMNTKLRNPIFDYVNIAVTYLGSDVFAVGVILALILLPKDYFRPFAVQSAITLVISTLVVQVLKRTIRRKRPFEQNPELKSIRIGVDPFSFPSGHTTAAFALATSISLLTGNPWLTLLFMWLAFSVGFSRVYLAVHFPTDVIAGASIGSLLSLITYFLMPTIRHFIHF